LRFNSENYPPKSGHRYRGFGPSLRTWNGWYLFHSLKRSADTSEPPPIGTFLRTSNNWHIPLKFELLVDSLGPRTIGSFLRASDHRLAP
jgi:hypothetical protein